MLKLCDSCGSILRYSPTQKGYVPLKPTVIKRYKPSEDSDNKKSFNKSEYIKDLMNAVRKRELKLEYH
jgi:hypothetical protein